MLTREEILSMPVGRELDALIAEKVMGIPVTKKKRRFEHVHVAPFSSNISAAFEVLRKTGRIAAMEGHFHTGWAVVLDGKFTATEWELPHALAKAALLAVIES